MIDNNFRLFLSGCEPLQNFQIATSVTKNVLLSYWYIKRRGKEIIEERFSDLKDNSMLLDSGAHTFLEDVTYKDKPIEFWENYIEGYLKFVRKHRDKIFACVEMDIDSIVGTEKVNEWREKYFHKLEEEGIQVIYVYHLEKGLAEWERMCQKYPYLGFSFREIEDEEVFKDLFDIAIKYKAKIHGFATNGTKALKTYPFYTVDASTWISGAQFGELNFFEDGKVKRLTKEKWKKDYRGKLMAIGAKWDLAEIEAPYELMRLSAISYEKFQSYVRDLNRGKKYWSGRREQRGDKVEEKLPPIEWFDSEQEDWKEWAEKLNIDTNIPKEVGTSLIADFYNFVKDTSTIEEYELEDLVSLCKLFDDNTSNTKVKCIRALKKYFNEHLKGERNDLADLSEPDVGEKMAKERQEYIAEKEFIEYEVSKAECDSILAGLLSSGEKDEVDKALIAQSIVPIYDKEGNLLKGVKQIRKRKSLSSKLAPRLTCDTCFEALRCPMYKAGYVCAYDKMFKQFDTRKPEDVIDGMSSIADLSLERLSRAVAFERMDGGVNTKAVSDAMAEAWGYLEKIKKLQTEGEQLRAEKKVIIDSEGNTEISTTITSNPKSGGVLEKIFASPSAGEVIDTEVVK